ncbi:MAG: alpha/beta hydrolase [Acidobacteria bacterium]|nr:alpha/beta hydrolase [Acidobacteriota bacterium]
MKPILAFAALCIIILPLSGARVRQQENQSSHQATIAAWSNSSSAITSREVEKFPHTDQTNNQPAKTTKPQNEPAAHAMQTAYPPLGKLVDIGGYRLHLYCTGKGRETVVLLAGSGDFSFDWSLTQASISRFARVCSYDRAGLAWSDAGPTPRTMKQEAYELHALLKAARIHTPTVLVGHSLGGLIARVYAAQYPKEVVGMVLVDATHEDTTLMYQGKLVRVRESATGKPIPPVQTMQSSPPQPPTAEDLEQFAFNQKVFGKPKTEAPFDKLPASIQAMRLWFRSQPPNAAAEADFWAEELQEMYLARAKTPYQLGNIPLVVLVTKPVAGNPPPGIATDEWQRINQEKRQQKMALTNLSHNSKLMVAQKSGHHIQLDEPQLVTKAIRQTVEAVRQHKKLLP